MSDSEASSSGGSGDEQQYFTTLSSPTTATPSKSTISTTAPAETASEAPRDAAPRGPPGSVVDAGHTPHPLRKSSSSRKWALAREASGTKLPTPLVNDEESKELFSGADPTPSMFSPTALSGNAALNPSRRVALSPFDDEAKRQAHRQTSGRLVTPLTDVELDGVDPVPSITSGPPETNGSIFPGPTAQRRIAISPFDSEARKLAHRQSSSRIVPALTEVDLDGADPVPTITRSPVASDQPLDHFAFGLGQKVPLSPFDDDARAQADQENSAMTQRAAEAKRTEDERRLNSNGLPATLTVAFTDAVSSSGAYEDDDRTAPDGSALVPVSRRRAGSSTGSYLEFASSASRSLAAAAGVLAPPPPPASATRDPRAGGAATPDVVKRAAAQAAAVSGSAAGGYLPTKTPPPTRQSSLNNAPEMVLTASAVTRASAEAFAKNLAAGSRGLPTKTPPPTRHASLVLPGNSSASNPAPPTAAAVNSTLLAMSSNSAMPSPAKPISVDLSAVKRVVYKPSGAAPATPVRAEILLPPPTAPGNAELRALAGRLRQTERRLALTLLGKAMRRRELEALRARFKLWRFFVFAQENAASTYAGEASEDLAREMLERLQRLNELRG